MTQNAPEIVTSPAAASVAPDVMVRLSVIRPHMAWTSRATPSAALCVVAACRFAVAFVAEADPSGLPAAPDVATIPPSAVSAAVCTAAACVWQEATEATTAALAAVPAANDALLGDEALPVGVAFATCTVA